jgi:membrane-bound lytic murein transglycosylase D
MRALAIVALCTTAAHAQPAVTAGPQAVPPVVSAGDPVLPQDPDGRKAVRGCAVGEECGRPSELLREFELEAFPPSGTSPWIDERVTGSRIEAAPVRRVKKPSELRPDQAWLDGLQTPDVPFTWSNQLIDYLLFYKSDPRGRSIMTAWIERQGRYRDLIVSHLRKAHLPEDLQYDAMIESSYRVDDVSSAGALGLWQFMKSAGKIYGLRQDRWVDERMDPLRSTVAQMDYFRDLYQRFGNWEVSLAAFNVGYGAMLRSMARYNTNDFYQLCAYENGMPWETCLYPPKILAAAFVGRNLAAFGYDTVKVQPAEVWDEVTVPTSVSLSVIARASGATEADIKRLNPHLKRDRTPPGEKDYIVRVPKGAKPDFQRKLVDLQSDWDGYDAYVVAHGERLEDVATIYGLSLSQLRKLNSIAQVSEIEGGTVLVVPKVTAEAREKNKAKAKANLVASGVDHKDGDETLIVPVPDKDFKIVGKQRVFYRVVSGDSVASIAKAFGIKSSQLVEWNGLDEGGKLQPRMVLQAFVPTDFDADQHKIALLDETTLEVVTRGSNEHLDLAEERTGRVRTEYISKGNEKLEDVAKRYGMGSHDLARINRISFRTVLEKGQKIIVYQVTDRTRSERAEEQWKKTPKARRGKTGTKAAPRTSEGPVTKPTQLDDEADEK